MFDDEAIARKAHRRPQRQISVDLPRSLRHHDWPSFARATNERGRAVGRRLDWCQNTSWNADIEAAYFDKLARAKSKLLYLRIQARFLAPSHPEVALRLLDQYFALGADSSEAEAHFYRARAYVALRDVDAAILSFEATLAREEAFPLFRTWAFHELPVLIATERISARYDRAIQVLMKSKHWLTFPVQHYQWHGALALILHEQDQTLEAKNEARQALEAARTTQSGFQYHPNLGLVAETTDEFGTRLRKIADKPRARLQWWSKWMP
jgi:tetratricopeptide (TPR) repeat protein